MKRAEAVLKDSEYLDYLERMDLAERHYPFCRHDLRHMLDVARVTYIMVLEQGAMEQFVKENGLGDLSRGREVIYAAGLLHDIGKWCEYEEGGDHSVHGARLAGPILTRSGFSQAETDLIVRSIFEHRHLHQNMSFLGQILYQADNLSRVCTHCAQRPCVKQPEKESETYILEY
ncbi:MAG: HD domain-containing protein [Solirubrobacterales bacterium]